MAREANITKDYGWFRYEAKQIRIAIDDGTNPVDLDGLNLRWLLQRQAGGEVLLTKTTPTGITVEGDDDEIAVITIAVGDYDSIPGGSYYHVLRDESADVILAYGDVYLHEGPEAAA